MNAIDRFKDGENWRYRDPKEKEFVGTMWLYGIHLPSIDDFIEGLQKDDNDKCVQLPDNKRADLLELRSRALEAYNAGNFELAEERSQRLNESCKNLGLNLIAVPDAIDGKKFKSGRQEQALAKHTKAILDVWRLCPSYTANQTFNHLPDDKRFEKINNDKIIFKETKKLLKRSSFGAILSRLLNRKGLNK